MRNLHLLSPTQRLLARLASQTGDLLTITALVADKGLLGSLLTKALEIALETTLVTTRATINGDHLDLRLLHSYIGYDGEVSRWSCLAFSPGDFRVNVGIFCEV